MKNYTSNLANIINQIKDGRRKQGRRYQIEVFVWLLLLGLLVGCGSLLEICETFRENQKLKNILSHLVGKRIVKIPHPTVVARALRKIDYQPILDHLLSASLFKLEPLAVALDGKVMNGIHDGTHRQILSFLDNDGWLIYQSVINTKENEITDFSKLLSKKFKHLPQGTIFSADAIQTQKRILKKIVSNGYHFVFKVKDNQLDLKQELEYIFKQGETDHTAPLKTQVFSTFQKSHDRFSEWKVVTTQDFDPQDLVTGFELSNTIGYLETDVIRPKYASTGKKHYLNSHTRVYFITSLANYFPQQLFTIMRNHWRVEVLHWLKDNLYREDQNTLKGKAAYFFTMLKSIALSLIKQVSVKIKSTMRKFHNDPIFLSQSLKQLGIM